MVIDFEDIWVKKWVYNSYETNDQRCQIILGNQGELGLISRQNLVLLKQLCRDDDKQYNEMFYKFSLLERTMQDQNAFQCDVADCQKLFFDIHKLREHVMEAHATEGLRRIAAHNPHETTLLNNH